MHLRNLAVNLLFVLQPILNVVYTTGLHMEKNERMAGTLKFTRPSIDEGKTFPSRKRTVLHFFGVDIFLKCDVS